MSSPGPPTAASLHPEYAAEHADAADLADLAGKALIELREQPTHNWDLGAAGDKLAHDLLVKELNRRYPNDDVRSEEGLEHVSGNGRLWIIDPLDGTREFRQRPRSDWAVHVAMVVAGEPVVGAVALPAFDMVLHTGAPPIVPPKPDGPPRLVVSRSRPPDVAYDVAETLGAEMLPMGSAGAKIAAVILGAADLYVHAGGQYEWDSGAPVAVALAAGLHACRLNGDPLTYGAPDAWLPDLMVCRPEYAEAVLAVTTAQHRPYW
ncbi:MAG TPA: 3'(2'),5'-bisphosphate nucleotidase CysQ [Acidimicrobiales bacterium]|jgi:3'(2'), 5'-bisphosphate nucleotidase